MAEVGLKFMYINIKLEFCRKEFGLGKMKGLKYIGSEMVMRLLGIQDQSLGERMVEAVNNLRTLDFTPVNHKSSNLIIFYQFKKHSRLFLARIQETY